MAASTRITANSIIFKIGATAYECDASKVELTPGDAPGAIRTFCEVAPDQEWTLNLEGVTSGDATSLYQVLFANYGTDVSFSVAPLGNTTPSADAPIYTGTVTFNQLPPLTLSAGEASQFTVALRVKNIGHDPAANNWYGLTKDVTP